VIPDRSAPSRPGHRDVGMVQAAIACALPDMASSGRRPGTAVLLRGTSRDSVAVLRDAPSDWGSQAPSHARLCRRRTSLYGARLPLVTKWPGI